MTTQEFIQSLKLLADFYESHPDMPAPIGCPLVLHVNATSKQHMVELLRMLGSFEKSATNDWFNCARKFGAIKLEVYADRKEVCEKRVVMKPVEEWVCPDSLLNEAKEAA